MKKTFFLKSITIITFLTVGFVMFLLPTKTSALHITYDVNKTPNQNCNFKINKGQCIRDIATKCGSTGVSCEAARNLVEPHGAFGGNIHLVCQATNIPNAQDCQRAVQAKCATTPTTACKEGVAQELVAAAGSPAGGTPGGAGGSISLDSSSKPTNDTCGGGNDENGKPYPKVNIQIDIGCKGQGNPIVDMAYAFIKFLTIGVGIVLVASIIYAGIQYTTSGGNPEETSKAKDRIMRAMVALLFYLLISAFVQFLVPGGLFS